MRRRKKLLILTGCTFAALVVLIVAKREREPSYEGRPLSAWLAMYGPRQGRTPPASEREKAADAIRQIGTNALLWLLAWVAYEPPISRYNLMPICQRLPQWILCSRPVQSVLSNRHAEERAQSAMGAFAILGPAAMSAIPELIRRTNLSSSPAKRDRAMLALTHLGQPAVPTMAALLSKPDGAADLWVMACIRNLGTNARPLVPILVQNLSNTNWFAATINARMLGELRFDPELVVPALTKCLQDPRREVRMESPRALMEFGELAREALPALSNALSDPDPDVRNNAARAIQAIAPRPQANAPVP
jgi:hypothetical protein